MNGAAPPSLIVPGDERAFEAAFRAHRPGYLPGWTARGDAGEALDAAFARMLAIQADGLNATPLRMQLEFLDSIGANVLPAQPARVALVFTLLETASADATVAAGTRAAAVLPPPAPSLDGGAARAITPPEFFTEQEITAMRGGIASIYSIDPQADRYTDHGVGGPVEFAAFDARDAVPHRLYLGHGELFKLAGSAEIVLSITFGAMQLRESAGSGQRPLLLDWEYLSIDGWQPLSLVEDETARFTRDGRITLHKRPGPDSKEDMIDGIVSSWIRATVSDRVPTARITQDGCSLDAQGRFVVQVESTIELLPGDVVTIDGNARATVLGITDASVQLDARFDDALAGEFLSLADALPPLRPEGADQAGALPQIDVIRARVGFEQTDLSIDGAYLEMSRIDISKDFHPFGEQPRAFAAFYVACKQAFPRTGARIELRFTFTSLYPEYQDGSATPPRLQAEFYDGDRWLALGADEVFVDGTAALTKGASEDDPRGTMSFISPAGWAESEINGDRQQWLRLRLVSGDYGQPARISVDPDPNDAGKYVVNSAPSTLKPPIVARLSVSYVILTNPQPLDACVTENDFAFADRSEDARWPRRPFAPFIAVSDSTPALHFGFSSRPPTALISMLVHVLEPAINGAPQPFVWDYWGERGWTELSVRDTTGGLARTGLVQFVGAPDAAPRDGLGGELYRIRARLKNGLASVDQVVLCGGAWLNAVWATQGQRVDLERLGISNGNPDQTFALPITRAIEPSTANHDDPVVFDSTDFERALEMPLAGVPVLAGERVEVREWSGRGEDWQTTAAGVDPSDLRFEVDPADPTVKTAMWVRWHPRTHFYVSGPGDRHYVVERARGLFRFPGVSGFVPPAGCDIVASYVTGGGIEGNVPANAIRELRSSVGFVQSVFNPLAPGGGAAAELLRDTRDRSAQTVRHRGRAVSCEDYEWLARCASSEVARARALPLEGPDGRGSRGFIGIVLIPHSSDAQPVPSARLTETVLAYLAQRAPAGIAGGVRAIRPKYVAIGVRADVLPLPGVEAGAVEALVRARLTSFLHPLTGGRDGRGWDFGRPLYLSDVATLIEAVPGVDAVPALQLMLDGALAEDFIDVAPDALISAGELQLKIVMPSAAYALA